MKILNRLIPTIFIFALALGMTVPALAADRSSVIASGDYKAGSSVYGAALTKEQLNDVADTVALFLNNYIEPSMSDVEKVAAACAFLVDSTDYAPDWSKNGANTAWGALIYKEAQCSGYARAFKALCDGMGIDCYYVHADATAINPSHQWNIVKVAGSWYHIDVQAFDDSGSWTAPLFILVSDDTYAAHGFVWDRSALPACPSDYDIPDLLNLTSPIPPAYKPSVWAHDDLMRAVELSLCSNVAVQFRQTATRAEFCELAVRLYEKVEGSKITALKDFADTNDINVRKMAGLGIVNGVGDGRFDPSGKLTREQAAVVLFNLMDALGRALPSEAASFADGAKVSPWALSAVGSVQAAGIMNGIGDNNFAPKDGYTREQCIVTILRAYDYTGQVHTDQPINFEKIDSDASKKHFQRAANYLGEPKRDTLEAVCLAAKYTHWHDDETGEVLATRLSVDVLVRNGYAYAVHPTEVSVAVVIGEGANERRVAAATLYNEVGNIQPGESFAWPLYFGAYAVIIKDADLSQIRLVCDFKFEIDKEFILLPNDIIGMTKDDAITTLKSLGFSNIGVTYRSSPATYVSSNFPTGHVCLVVPDGVYYTRPEGVYARPEDGVTLIVKTDN
jgi:hypothetical protein